MVNTRIDVLKVGRDGDTGGVFGRVAKDRPVFVDDANLAVRGNGSLHCGKSSAAGWAVVIGEHDQGEVCGRRADTGGRSIRLNRESERIAANVLPKRYLRPEQRTD